MNYKNLGAAALLLLGPVAPAFAGAVYVPLATDHTVEDVRYRTQIWATNTGGESRQFVSYFIPSETDGVDRPEEWGDSTVVAPGETRLLGSVSARGDLGMVEISGAPQIAVSARMVATMEGVSSLGTPMPVISSDNQLPEDAVAHLQGWIRSNALRSDFGIVNLGRETASCSISVFRSDGSQIRNTAVVLVPPLSNRQFDDALNILGETAIAAVRSETSCDQPFYAYLRTYDRETGELYFTAPSSQLAESILLPPGNEPPPANCPNGATCFEFLNSPFQPTTGNQVRRVQMPLAAGQYSRIQLQMDVLHGGWHNPTSGLHNILWLALERNRDLFGYINLLGPNRNEIMLRHGIGVPQGQKARILRPLAVQPGSTYHFDYVYDTSAGFVELVVSRGGQELVRIVDSPNVNRINVGAGESFLVDMGFQQGLNPNEPATFGWRYSNLRVQFIP